MACRDCSVCTRAVIVRLLYFLPHLFYAMIGKWTFGLFKRHCPDCGHWLTQHSRREDGTFRD